MNKIELYREMKRIRLLEERIKEEFPLQEMRTPMHSCIGQEAVAVGTCQNLLVGDVVYSNHRGHGHYLAKGGDMNALVAELYNRAEGCSKGWGGSMHILDLNAGVGLTSSIVAGTVPIATGHALGFHIKKADNVAVAFLGDGASEEGGVYESICFAKLKKLPIIYVCENNLYAMYTGLKQREPLDNIAGKFSNILPSETIDGNDVETVFEAVAEAVKRARSGEGPAFIECSTYRYRNHYESADSEDFWYRTKEEWEEWNNRCPIRKIEEKIRNESINMKDQLDKIDQELKEEIENAFLFAKRSPYPNSLYDFG